MREWKPIETAPKNGEEYLVFCCDTGEQFVCVTDEDGRHIYARSNQVIFKCSPSYWTPLPEPPEE